MSKIIQDVNLGVNLRKLRKAKGLTQEQVCAQMGLAGRPMSQSSYAQIETGARNIYASDLIVVVRVLGATFEDVFRDLKPINKYDLEGNLT